MNITHDFDGGNIVVLDATNPADLRLEIRPDVASDFYQWFNFRVADAKGQALSMRIVNAGDAAYPKGWEGYHAVASYDRRDWFRVPASYAEGVLTITHTPEHDVVQYAYFAPYSLERHLDLIARVQMDVRVTVRQLGRTLMDHPLDVVEMGDGERHVWVIARQHPGESMASWWMEGFLDRLISDDPVAVELLSRARLHIVPNMNPDGSLLGNLRTNQAGANLNREWNVATLARSPEVFLVREAMVAAPPTLCLDVHGDEALPYNFIAGAEGVERWNADMAARQDAFLADYVSANSDFQTEIGYPVTAPGKANLAMCTNYVAQTHGALAMTLEMPFKDNANAPDSRTGWSPERCAQLGRDVLRPMLNAL